MFLKYGKVQKSLKSTKTYKCFTKKGNNYPKNTQLRLDYNITEGDFVCYLGT